MCSTLHTILWTLVLLLVCLWHRPVQMTLDVHTHTRHQQNQTNVKRNRWNENEIRESFTQSDPFLSTHFGLALAMALVATHLVFYLYIKSTRVSPRTHKRIYNCMYLVPMARCGARHKHTLSSRSPHTIPFYEPWPGEEENTDWTAENKIK